MKIEDLKDGQAYRLTRDVTNPKPDRREKYAWTKFVTWEKGTVLYFRHDGDVYFREFRAQGYAGSMYASHEGYLALVEAMEVAPRTFDNVIFALGGGTFTGVARVVLGEYTDLARGLKAEKTRS